MPDVVVAQNVPYAIQAEAGRKYWWCACGRSSNQPFCDGSHKGTGLSPLPFVADKSETLWLCGCKHTGHAPFCDGTHKSL